MLPLLLSTGHYILKQNVGVKQTKQLCLYWANDILAVSKQQLQNVTLHL